MECKRESQTSMRDYMKKLRLDEAELSRRRAYFDITDADLARLASLRGFAENHTDEIVEEFYRHILEHADSRKFFPDEATVRRVKTLQRHYFLDLFSGVLDLKYVEDRLRVGATHERIGMPPKFYLGSYAHYLRLVRSHLAREFGPGEEETQAFNSIQKLVYFDMALAMDTYILTGLEDLRRHQAAIRELSTPVIRVFRHILLLPLVGAVDTQRAQQIMETVLLEVIQEHAKVIIIDIAGVLVVDTKVADHLLKTTAAVRLLGAETVLTGIRAEVARTIVQLGVDTSTMHTRSRLAEGIELALNILGKTITDRPHERGAPRDSRSDHGKTE
jgi:rsbT co-antagonist protein RsbR